MATTGEMFDRNCRDAAAAGAGYPNGMIHTVMNRADWAILAALALIWGAAFLFIKVAVTHFEPLTYVWLRLSIAALGLGLWLRWRGERLALPGAVWASILLLALLNNVIPFALFGWGQTRIASGLASILNATTPVWGVLVAHLMTRDERMTPAKLFGVAAGLAGVAVMIGPALLANLGGDLMAQLACLTGAFCYALAGVWARRFKAQGIAPSQVAAAQLIAGALVMAPVVLAVDGRPALDVPAEAWGALVALALVCTAFAYVLYFKLIGSAGATNALLVTLLVPPVAILVGALVLGEQLDTAHFAGLGLIALGLAAIDGRLLTAGRRLRPA